MSVIWGASSSSSINWLPLTSIISDQDASSVNFLVVASEYRPTHAVADFRAWHATDSQITVP